MSVALICVGVVIGITTAIFGFGGGFVAVPVLAWADASLGGEALRVATATSLVVMLINAGVATAAARRSVLGQLRGRARLILLLGVGGMIGALAGAHVPPDLLRWGFVVYAAVTVIDLLTRPGFFSSAVPERGSGETAAPRPLADIVGIPIGAIAALLGVGGSVMTVPALRRAGVSMRIATTLANPLTIAIVAPAALVTLATAPPGPHSTGMVGVIDLRSAVSLLAGAIPIVTALRRTPIHIPDRIHAQGYLLLLITAATAVALR